MKCLDNKHANNAASKPSTAMENVPIAQSTSTVTSNAIETVEQSSFQQQSSTVTTEVIETVEQSSIQEQPSTVTPIETVEESSTQQQSSTETVIETIEQSSIPQISSTNGTDEATNIQPANEEVPQIRVKSMASLMKPDQTKKKPEFNRPTRLDHAYTKKQPPNQNSMRLLNGSVPSIRQKESDELNMIVVTKNETQNETTYSLKKVVNNTAIIEPASTNQSPLQIEQVFEGVNQTFVENLLIDKSKQQQQAKNKLKSTVSPLLDSLVEQVANKQNAPQPRKQNPEPVVFVDANSSACLDLRCNICLELCSTSKSFEEHMINKHDYPYVCSTCHETFKSLTLFAKHTQSKGQCIQTMNKSRPYNCIVPAPTILLKNNKIDAFKCKHCRYAFHDQRLYVQHAQRHSTLFRCKLCKLAKAMEIAKMRFHLKYETHSN